jgi:hypothetical protein
MTGAHHHAHLLLVEKPIKSLKLFTGLASNSDLHDFLPVGLQA